MNEPKPCSLVLEKRGQDTRVMIFSSHYDALDVALRFGKQGWNWAIQGYETYGLGEKPIDTPAVQNPLFGGEADNA